MKIIKLTFENINSYEGEVTIDFTDPGIQKGNNQFVVCGPMGSGKSTILDAITLALYGSTDRLGRLTTSSADNSNELINKHSGYCRAEVIYSCTKGVFASAFELHKARDKADGKVQTPQCALYEMAGGERIRNLLDSTSTDTLKKKTEEVIGLSYEQFIRCILIPQGEFDQFLNSNEREKASILAKLSHTEHYKEAARILNEKASSLNLEYTGMKKERDAISVMTEEARNECEKKKADLQKRAEEFKEKCDDLIKKIDWLKQLDKAESDFREAKESLDKIQARSEEYRLKTEVLNKAKKAEDCAAEYRSFMDCVEEQKTEQKKLMDAEEKLDLYVSKKEEADKYSKRCTEEYEKKKEEKKKQKDIWVQVRSLDSEISVAKKENDINKEVLEKSNQNFVDKKADYNRLEASLSENTAAASELSEYLNLNKADEALNVTLISYAEKRKAWKDAGERHIQAEKELSDNRKKRDKLQNEINDLTEQKAETEKELHDLVSSKYLLVAGILRQDLKPGTMCPVCGKEFEPNSDIKKQDACVHPHDELKGEQNQVAKDISALNDILEEKENEINRNKEELQDAENKMDFASQNAERERVAITGFIEALNAMLQTWDLQVDEQTSEKESEEIAEKLRERKDKYIEKAGELDQRGKVCEKARAEMNSIDLKKLSEERDDAEHKYKSSEQKYEKLKKDRQDLFGTQSVDEAERAFDEALGKKEKEKGAADEKLKEIVNQYNTTQTQIEEYKKRIEDLEKKQSERKQIYIKKLEENHFASEEEFLSCKRSDQIISDLDHAINEYNLKKAAAETTFKDKKTTLDELRSNVLTTESSETLNGLKNDLEANRNECIQQIGGLGEKLDQDSINRKAWEDADLKLQRLGTEAKIYSRINEMLGKKDGSDFEVFVQGIAMRSLLEKANVYLESIIPKYRLVQRSDNSIDFLVHETMGDLTVIKREVKNFSGGEKFIISLSLALAMAEFAGQNGDVDCIFLDEGFGTLSGAPLLDAINALKRLSSTGKMLGIITHIEAVIQAFNKIEARKIGEKSRLYGPGVTYTDRNTRINYRTGGKG